MTTKAQRPRQVGVCLKHLPADDTSARFHHDNVPWQRVINAKGIISPRFVLFPCTPCFSVLTPQVPTGWGA